MIEPDALSLLSDKESMTDLITDAGLDPDTLPGCTLKNWQALQSVLDSCVPAVNGEELNVIPCITKGADRVRSAPFVVFCVYTFFSTYWRVPMPIFSACSSVAFHSILGLESLKLSWWQFQPGFARFWPSWLFGSGCAFRQASAQA